MNNKALNTRSSPHLAMVLDQLAKAGELDELARDKILVSFETAVSRNGKVEIGFSREEGQSFNPRAARILLILLQDAKIRDENLLLLAANQAGLGEEYQGYLDLAEPVIVSAAFLLDRLRHLHLEPQPSPEVVYEACLKANEFLSGDFSKLCLLLEKGVERMRRSLS